MAAWRRGRSLLAALFLFGSLLQAAPPKLVVVLSFDQLRGDYFEANRRFLRRDGFRRFEAQGVIFENSAYKHANNITGPGHAALLTGCYPHKSGITGNEFCDLRLDSCMYCVQDDAAGLSPRNLLVPTVGDVLRARDPKCKVFGISMKDRAAILMAGKKPTGAIWFDATSLSYTTSAYYKRPAWLTPFNTAHPASDYSGKTWTTSISDSLYPRVDDQVGEGTFSSGRRTFPYTMPPLARKDAFAADFVRSPFSVQHLFALASTCVDREKLGADSHPDLLCVGISSTDALGHSFGPDSREVQEMYVACDSLVAVFLHHLDSTVGPSNYAVFITSDHGVAPIPEIIRNQGGGQGVAVDAGRIREAQLKNELNAMLNAKYAQGGKEDWVRDIFEPSIFLHYEPIQRRSLSYDSVVAACVQYLRQREGIGIALSKHDLMRGACPADCSPELCEWLQNSCYPNRYGDVVVYPKMYWIIGAAQATHGTPYVYDRMVPMMVLIPSAPNGGLTNKRDIFRDVSPVDIAPTIAAWWSLSLKNVDGTPLPLDCGK